MNLKGAYQKVMAGRAEVKPRVGQDVNPLTQDGSTFMLSPDMLPDGKSCRQGDTLMIKAKVKSVGSKIALTPVSVSATTDGDDVEDDGDMQ